MLLGDNIDIGSTTPYAKERAKWEMHHSRFGPPGRPYVYQPYPTMMYKASRGQGGLTFEGQVAETEVQRESFERIGFVYGGQAAALEALEKREYEMAELAANRAANDRKMSPAAQVEADARDSTSIRHLPDLGADPLPPRKK